MAYLLTVTPNPKENYLISFLALTGALEVTQSHFTNDCKDAWPVNQLGHDEGEVGQGKHQQGLNVSEREYHIRILI